MGILTSSHRPAAAGVILPLACLLSLLSMSCQSRRTESLLEQMTLEEKLTLLRGDTDPEGNSGAGYMPGISRLGIPPLRLSDGPAGIRTHWPATALPAPVALGASFDPSLARAYGEVVGRDGRARQQDVLLSPMVNIVRVPHAGRNFETFSEDPLLSARMVAEEVRGVQSQGLIATVKHYIANNFERARNSASSDVSDRALHEIYLPGFEAAVQAGVGAVMCAYNRVNGVYACDDPHILNDILRDELGFEGWVMTDWGANHTMDALEHGLDQEMPGGRGGSGRRGVYFGDSLQAAVEAGQIPMEWVDRAAGRILGQMERIGLLDGSLPPRPAMDDTSGAEVALNVALAGAVLLRNQDGLLPLPAASLGSVLVVGPTAAVPLVGGGGSSRVTPLRSTSFMEALQERADPGVSIQYATGMELDGTAIPASALTPPPGTREGGNGLLRSTQDSAAIGVDREVDFTGDEALPPGSNFIWSGRLTAPTTGDYEIRLHTQGGRASITVDGQRVSGGGGFGGGTLLPTTDGLSNSGGIVHLEAGVPHEISLTASPGGRGGAGEEASEPLQLRLAWITPQAREAALDEAVRRAGDASAVVLFAHQEGSEGSDRPSLSLPGVQDELISRVAAANPRTVVVLNTGAPVLMPWIDDVSAVLEVWYGGQEGGEAMAKLLLGEANPRGKLPESFPRTETGHATGEPARYPGVDGQVSYDEGIFVGYRWFDAEGVEPLFPFGHGLSYTTFAYSDLDVRNEGDGYVVRFTLSNTGDVAGVEVPQLYLGPPDSSPVPLPPKALANFEAVRLEPGQSREVSLEVDGRALSYWSEQEGAWVLLPGSRHVYVGSSSRDIRLEGTTGG